LTSGKTLSGNREFQRARIVGIVCWALLPNDYFQICKCDSRAHCLEDCCFL